jgi:hypothetical protein
MKTIQSKDEATVTELTDTELEAVAGGMDADRAAGDQNRDFVYECSGSPSGQCRFIG